MIVAETGKRYCVYIRTSKRVRWKYAEYGGRYATLEEAIKAAHVRANGGPAQARIEDMFDELKSIVEDIHD